MTDDELAEKIGKTGDALWNDEKPRTGTNGYIYINESPEENVGAFALIPTAIAYLVVLTAWEVERRIAHFLGRSYFCPLCHNPMSEPLVYCPHCGRVQSRLRPAPGGIFTRVCPGCGKGRWKTLGQYFRSRPAPLICRDTEWVTGCYRPHRIPHLAGRYRAKHLALMGSTVAAKHVAMAHLFCHMAKGPTPGEASFRAGWKLSEMEVQLCRQVLYKGYQEDTRRYESPGQGYTLASTFILNRPGDRTLRVFHNVLDEWFVDENALHDCSMLWRNLDGLIFVLDGDQLSTGTLSRTTPPVELYSRILRAIEQARSLTPQSRLPIKVAVIVTFSSVESAEKRLSSRSYLTCERARDLVLQYESSLHALLQRSVPPHRLQFWTGVMPRNLELSNSAWMRDLITWTI